MLASKRGGFFIRHYKPCLRFLQQMGRFLGESMILLIDGYNVMHAVGRGHDETGGERRYFLKLVSEYARIKKHEAYVFFDGGSSPFPTNTEYDGVLVSESGYQHSADDVLRSKLDFFPPETVLVVSSDHVITNDAESHGIISMDAAVFYHRMKEVICAHEQQVSNANSGKRDGGFQKISKNESPGVKTELDLLMERACANVRPKLADLESDRQDDHACKKKGHKKSKAEKRLERVIKKI